MTGAYHAERSVLRFEPKSALDPGVKYRAVFHPDQLPAERALEIRYVSAAFQVSLRGSDAATVVSQVYPSAELLPENLLRFYLHFSAPMSRVTLLPSLFFLPSVCAGQRRDLFPTFVVGSPRCSQRKYTR